MKIPKVSVVLTTFNRPEMLKEAVECVLAQTFRDFECIVVDDGSHTAVEALNGDLSKRFLDAGLRLLVLDLPENSGFQSVPNNVAFQYTQGSYIAQADDDDLWDNDHLETLVTAIEERRVDLVYARFRNENKVNRGGPPDGSEFPHVPFNWLTRNLLAIPQTNFIKTDCLWSKASVFAALGSKPWNENIRKFGDWDFVRRCADAGLMFYGVDKVTMTYRWGHEQIQLDRPLNEHTSNIKPMAPPKWQPEVVPM